MRPGHSDVEQALVRRQIPRRVQRHLSSLPAEGHILARLLACAGDGRHGALAQIDGAKRVIFGVGDVERIRRCVKSHALRMIEGRRIVIAVTEADVARADGFFDGIVNERHNDDAIMVRVADE